MGRQLTILLIISLAINVFGLGFFAARVIDSPEPPHHEQMPPPRGLSLDFNPLRLMREADNLSPEGRAQIRAAMRAELPNMRAENRKIKMQQRELARILREQGWDRELIETRLAVIKDGRGRQFESISTAFLDAVEQLSEEDRTVLLEAAMKGGHGEKGDRPRGRFRDLMIDDGGSPPPSNP